MHVIAKIFPTKAWQFGTKIEGVKDVPWLVQWVGFLFGAPSPRGDPTEFRANRITSSTFEQVLNLLFLSGRVAPCHMKISNSSKDDV